MDALLPSPSRSRRYRRCTVFAVALVMLAGPLSCPELAAAAPAAGVTGPGGVAVPTGTVTPRAASPARAPRTT